jgi:hypothetical protein
MRILLLLLLFFHSSVAFAQATPAGEPLQSTETKIGKAATQPLADVNLQRRVVPPVLAQIVQNPYSLKGIRRCRDVNAELADLNSVLGPDFDAPLAENMGKKRRDVAVGLAGDVITGLIPFRFLIREFSGANKADETYRAAIYAGAVRRGFLKGYAQHRRCAVPKSTASTVQSVSLPIQIDRPLTAISRRRVTRHKAVVRRIRRR